MPNKEAVVLILDANESMAKEVSTETNKCKVDDNEAIRSSSSPPSSPPSLHKTRFDCAKEVGIAIISDLMVRSKTNEVTILVLHTEETHNYFFEEGMDLTDEDVSCCEEKDDAHCPFPNITEISGNGELMGMGICRPEPGLLRKIHQLKPSKITNVRRKRQRVNGTGGDFESGLVYAADALHRRTAGKKFERRIVLLTDAEHKIRDDEDSKDISGHRIRNNSSEQRLLVALDSLRTMECRIQVVGMDFEHAADFGSPARGPPNIRDDQMEMDEKKTYIEEDDESESESEDEVDDDDEDDDMLEIKRNNEEYLLRLAKMTGGFVYASNEMYDIRRKLFGSRSFQNPGKRKLIVEIAPDLVLEDARYYKLITGTASPRLIEKLAVVDQDSHSKICSNTLGDQTLQDFEKTTTHWNADDENEELLEEQRTDAYRFGSDLLPFSKLDDEGLKEHSPVKLTILGYVPESSVPHYLRIDSPYVLTGNESRRCCAAISALAIGLRRSKQVAIATFVKGVNSDPILCGLFPLREDDNEIDEIKSVEESSNQQPLRLIIMQLPFSGDVRYPHLDYPNSYAMHENISDDPKRASLADCCDTLIQKLMLPRDVLDYEQIPNHKIRSFNETVTKRVLDKTCNLVATRIDPVSGADSMDTPLEIRKQAQSVVQAFYDSFRLMEKTDSTGI